MPTSLARRYFALWADYLTALGRRSAGGDCLQRLDPFTGQFATGRGERAAALPVLAAVRRSAPGRGRGPQAAAAPLPAHLASAMTAVGQLARRVCRA